MWTGLPSALRFARSWPRPPSGIRETEVLLPIPGEEAPVPGTVVAVAGSSAPRGWVVLHGITRPGRRHPELLRFVRAVASTGATVLVPEVRDWIDLRFAPERAQRILRAAVDWLYDGSVAGAGYRGAPQTFPPGPIAPGGIMLAGFSFGAPQALLAASDPEVARQLRAVVAWGGYGDLDRIFRFSFTGEHRWEGKLYRQVPDPYVRWIIGANCLPLSTGKGKHDAVVEALHRLAAEAGDRRVPAGGPALDPVKEELRRQLAREDRPLFELFAPPAGGAPDRTRAEALVSELVPVIRREMPLLDPLPLIREIPVPVRILHGRSDQLIPFTEALYMGSALVPRVADLSTRVTGLFSHSGGSTGGRLGARAREGVRFLAALRSVFQLA